MTSTATTTATPATAWTARRVLESLREVSPLRVINVSGPSVFETICELDGFGVADGHFNAMTPRYHWHLALDRFRHLTTKDEVHERSGRRVLFYELREEAGAEPFLLVYLHRGKGEEFSPEREAAFAEAHRVFAGGAALEAGR